MSRIERKAQQILKELGITEPPVPIQRVAQELGLEIEPAALGDGISGILVIEGDKGKIGYNRVDAEVRQRFTIAHELAHYILHRGKRPIFIDRKYAVYLRSGRSSTGEDRQEIQANQMAAALLMPSRQVRAAVRDTVFDLGDEEGIQELAEQFNVSTQAMSFRLLNLGLGDGLEPS